MPTYYSKKKALFVKKLRDEGCSWPDVEDAFEKKFGERKSHDTLRISTKRLLGDEANYRKKAGETREEGRKALIKSVAQLAKQNGGRLTHQDMTKGGFTKDTIKPHFSSVKALISEVYLTNTKVFRLGEEEVDHTKLRGKIKDKKTILVTTVVSGALADPKVLASLTNYCKINDAIVLYIPVSDPASNRYNAHMKAKDNLLVGIDKRIINNPYFYAAVGDNIKLCNKLLIANIKTSAKQTDPTTGLGRIANKLGSIIVGSPKQRLVSIPTSTVGLPRLVMTTGCITVSDYETDHYLSLRTSFLSKSDHMMGAVVVNLVDDERFHFRQIQFNKQGNFTDLGVVYKSNSSQNNQRAEALVMGDWHSGSTDPAVIKATTQMCKELSPKYLVVHDGFDGLSITHHEFNKKVLKSKRANEKQNSLLAEVKKYAKDLAMLGKLGPQLVIVKSNHDAFLSRYLDAANYLDDTVNHSYALKLAHAYAIGKDPLKFAVETCGVTIPDNIIWLNRDDSFKVKGIELAAHGDQGPNGSRGTLKNLEACYGKCVIGHSHTPGILRDAYQVGTSTYLNLDYATGPSSWLQTHCVIYSDGSRQLLNIILGKWRK